MHEFPVLFLSHGAPDLVLSQEPARQAIVNLGQNLPRPKGILIVSAHWQATQFTLGETAQYSTIYDFSGFPAPLYQLEYPARGAGWFSTLCKSTLQEAGISYSVDEFRGLDHGAWIPLMLAWPRADIPVQSLSLKLGTSPQELLELGQALQPLRRAGILIIASGAITHNLGTLLPSGTPPEPWAEEFTTWVQEKLLLNTTADLLTYRQTAPHALMAHPTTEHFEPLFIAYGAGGEQGTILHHKSFSYGNLAMDIYQFGS